MTKRSLAWPTAATLVSAVLLLGLVGVSAAQTAQKTERQRRKYQPPLQTLAPSATAKAEPERARAWRLHYRGWDTGSLFLGAGEGEVTIQVGGEEPKAAPDARGFLLHDRTGGFMAYVEGDGDAMGSLTKLAHELEPVLLTESGVAEVLKDGAEMVLHDGRRFEVSAEDRAAAAALAGQPAGASVVAEQEIVIWGLAEPGPLLDVKRLP